jgi:hypothetical protein
MKIVKNDQHQLVLSANRLGEFFGLLPGLFFFLIWYGGIAFLTSLGWTEISGDIPVLLFILMFWLGPLIKIKEMVIKPFKRVIFGEKLVFDNISGSVTRNKKEIIKLSDINFVRVKTKSISGDGTPIHHYYLSLNSHNDDKIEIDDTGSRNQAYKLAESFAEFTNTEIMFEDSVENF